VSRQSDDADRKAKQHSPNAELRKLPSVASLTAAPMLHVATLQLSDEISTKIAQDAIAAVRDGILAGEAYADPASAALELAIRHAERLTRPRLSEVINGTGVIVHTNLGRAPVSRDTEAAMRVAAARYTPLELEIETGRRGGRMSEISRMLRLLAGAEASLVVNNNAAAVLLVLSALSAGKEVVLARSQVVEIGGGFRIPDVLAQSGAKLVEVGTTNRVYASDYERAIGPDTGALLMVHWSNFKIIGFTAQPETAELAALASRHGLPLIEDLGSGALMDTAPYGLQHEPTVGESLADGVDVVCFSGDKLLGGPQAGIISGRADLVYRVERHPLARAVRADKTALAGVAATLRHYLRGEAAVEIPVWRMISMTADDAERRCRMWREHFGDMPGVAVVPSRATVGGGSLPGETVESRALAFSSDAAQQHGITLDEFARRLRVGSPAVMPRLEDERLLVDARTVLPHQDVELLEALSVALAGISPG
jgi:L-seryl-tRNA(Ser) seleniumtransferase